MSVRPGRGSPALLIFLSFLPEFPCWRFFLGGSSWSESRGLKTLWGKLWFVILGYINKIKLTWHVLFQLTQQHKLRYKGKSDGIFTSVYIERYIIYCITYTYILVYINETIQIKILSLSDFVLFPNTDTGTCLINPVLEVLWYVQCCIKPKKASEIAFKLNLTVWKCILTLHTKLHKDSISCLLGCILYDQHLVWMIQLPSHGFASKVTLHVCTSCSW